MIFSTCSNTSGKVCQLYRDSFDFIFEANGTKVKPTAVKAPDMNAYIERFIGSLRRECLNQLMIFSEIQLKHVVREYVQFYNTQRPHQGINNQIPKPPTQKLEKGQVVCRERLGGLLNSYERLAA